MLRVAFYKGRGNWFNRFIRFWDGGPYSHCELVFSSGVSASASWQDGRQVRSAFINFRPEHWDFIELPAEWEAPARVFLDKTEGAKYDLVGQVRFFIAPLRGARKGYWCSEWVAAALGFPDPWRYSPNNLFSAVSRPA